MAPLEFWSDRFWKLSFLGEPYWTLRVYELWAPSQQLPRKFLEATQTKFSQHETMRSKHEITTYRTHRREMNPTIHLLAWDDSPSSRGFSQPPPPIWVEETVVTPHREVLSPTSPAFPKSFKFWAGLAPEAVQEFLFTFMGGRDQ